MSRRRHTPEQIITALREAEVGLANGKTVAMVSRELGISEQTYSRSSPRRSPRQPDRSIEELPLTFTHNSGLDLWGRAQASLMPLANPSGPALPMPSLLQREETASHSSHIRNPEERCHYHADWPPPQESKENG